ncbi:VanZ family protein [Flavobacteriaceae sp. LMIT009]
MVNKHLFLFAAIVYSIVLTSVLLVPNHGIPYFGTSYEDKIYHLVAYGLLCFLWTKVFLAYGIKRSILLALILSIVYGTVIEVLQGYLTDTRRTSIGDGLANGVGAIIVSLILTIKQRTSVKKL